MFVPQLPAKPVDRYTVVYWQLSLCSSWCYIDEMRAVYYAHTPWEEFDPDRKGGKPLFDDWMISKKISTGGWSPQGRFVGWDTMGKAQLWNKNWFATRDEAVNEARQRFDKYVEDFAIRLADVKRIRDSIN